MSRNLGSPNLASAQRMVARPGSLRESKGLGIRNPSSGLHAKQVDLGKTRQCEALAPARTNQT